MTDLVLRAPEGADIPALSALAIASFVAKFGTLYRPEDLIPFLVATHSESAWATEMADPKRRICVAERGGVLVGWAKLSLVCGFPEYARNGRAMELKQLYTAPNSQGGGIGTALMDWAMDTFAQLGADEVQLSVWSENPGAQKFYARHGFEKVGEVTFPVGQQLDHEFLYARLL